MDVNQIVLVNVDIFNDHVDSSIDDHILGIYDCFSDSLELILELLDLLDGEGTAEETLDRLG